MFYLFTKTVSYSLDQQAITLKMTDQKRPGGGRHLSVTWRGSAHVLRIFTTRSGKKFAFRYPVSESLHYKNSKNNRENNSLLFLKTIAYCYWTNSHKLFRNFWSIFIPGSGIYAEKWYSEKRHFPYRFIWKCLPGKKRLDLYVVFTMILCGRNFCVQ